MSSKVILGGLHKIILYLVGNLVNIFNLMEDDPSNELTTLITSSTNLESLSCRLPCFFMVTCGITAGDGESIAYI